MIPTPDYSQLERDQVARLAQVRARRDRQAVGRALDALREGAATYVAAPGGSAPGTQTPLMSLLVDAVRARATVGEISGVFEAVWGRYQPGV